MSVCSVIGCSTKIRKRPPDLSLHRLPTNEERRKTWLDVIGIENIDLSKKRVLVCSLHFDESSFNRTLDALRLKDDAVPSRMLMPSARPTRVLRQSNQNEIATPVHGNTKTMKRKGDFLTQDNLPPAKSSKTSNEVMVPCTSFSQDAQPPAKSITSNESTSSAQDEQPSASTTRVLRQSNQNEIATPVHGNTKTMKRKGDFLTQDNLPPAKSSKTSNEVMVPCTSFSQDEQPSAKAGTSNESTSAAQDEQVDALCFSVHQEEAIPLHIITALPNIANLAKTTCADDISKPQVSRQQDPTIQIIKKLKEKCQKQARKIKRLNEKIRRQKKKIANLANIITDLKERNLLNSETAVLLESCAGPQDFLKRQIAKSKGLPLERQYTEEIRKFAITLHFFSPKAYNFVRAQYNTCLPHPRTLSKWYQHVNAEPGFCAEAFETLQSYAQKSNHPVVCAITFDEMSIRKSLCWDAQKKTYCGRVNFGATLDSDDNEIANQALVFLVTCINGQWKLPVGYFFISSITGEQKAALLDMCLQKCHEVGVKIVSTTCDGPAANLAMFSTFGCEISKNQNETTFDCHESKIHIFIDPCHAIKLIRNAFGELRVFYDVFGRKVDFAYLERLQDLQEIEGLHLANKLTKAHIMFAKQKMKVRLATQLLSNSVADAIEFCEDKLKMKSFEGSAGTVNFVRILNDVFDVLNSHSVRPPGWKKAMCPENIGFIEGLFDGAIRYVNELKLPDGQLLVNSKRKTGFIGLIVDMRSALALYKYLVEDLKVLKYIPLYKISQDHIELFFSAVRARGGFNNNPNAVQFKAAFKRLLIRAEIRDGGVGNCIPLEQINILTCSSGNPIKSINDLTKKNYLVEEDSTQIDSTVEEQFIAILINEQTNTNQYTNNAVAYIAGFVARKLTKSLKCEVCISLLYGNSDDQCDSLIATKTRGGLVYPSKDLQTIVTKTEKLLKSVFRSKNPSELYYMQVFKFFFEYFSRPNDYL